MTPRLAELTTLRLGGPARRLVEATTEAELLAAVESADEAGEPLLVLAGGSNLVIADDGFDGTVVLVRTRGVERADTRLTVAAGEPWDVFVDTCVDQQLAGVECLAGIPGSVGATPIQNVGAYGQEVADTITSVRALDRRTGDVVDLAPADCGFSYRSSAFKRDPEHWLVLAVTFELEAAPASRPLRYAELARSLGVTVGASAPLADIRDAVLALRRSKGMVLDGDDADTRSAGSFFTNPILSADAFATLRAHSEEPVPAWPEPDGRVKTSAAWLIQRAGFDRGDGDRQGIAISSKHALALTNRGGGSASELLAFARSIAAAVRETFGVELEPEPRLVGLPWP
jgi:UDP-N-acetylmuramate dehydrogenase